ncbi:hypothetical protein QF035_011025 [Streptomyces umbrinus]|uniref:Uncharacterized protein n=1 Tax=Streptomyces umbrinus TaxID=67370 RepID=A0ABU0TCM9_9ACTN|nr:hypothetical protein [Streptomyces umbrinus]
MVRADVSVRTTDHPCVGLPYLFPLPHLPQIEMGVALFRGSAELGERWLMVWAG